jgi:hypothetical protein
MPFYIRKSVSAGPFRLNVSKSGLGISAGVKGARLSTGPRGTYVNMGRGGVYYRQRIAGPYGQPNGASHQHPHIAPPGIPVSSAPQPTSTFAINTAGVDQLIESSSQEMLAQINERATQMVFFPIVCAIVAVLIIVAATLSPVLSLIILILGVPFAIWTHRGDKLKRTIPLFYEFSPEAVARFDAIQAAIAPLSHAQKLWRLRTQQATGNYKYNAGATSLITRHPAAIRNGNPPYIATNVSIWVLDLQDQEFYFMPDQILVRQGKTYGAVSYDTLKINVKDQIYIETEGVPRDAALLDYTWQYTNKRGGPDRRFKNNRQIPRLIYGHLTFASPTGLNVVMYVSNRQIPPDMLRLFSSAIGHTPQTAKSKESSYRQQPTPQPIRTGAYQILNIAVGASREEITVAYHHMARMYHPDKVAGLAPEFRELAEERMKEINAAYEELKRSHAA